MGHCLPRKPSPPRTALRSHPDCTDTGQKADREICHVLAHEPAEGAPGPGWARKEWTECASPWSCGRGKTEEGHKNKDQNQASCPPSSGRVSRTAQHTAHRLTRLCTVKCHNHFKKSIIFLFMSLKLHVNLYYSTISTLPKNV